MGAGTRGPAQERTVGKSGPRADVRAAASVHREEPHRRESRHIYQGRQRDTGDEKFNERDFESGHHVLRLRHKGKIRARTIVALYHAHGESKCRPHESPF